MEKERVAIKMQRHLRPLTAAPKKTKTRKSENSEIRPVTAAASRSRARIETASHQKKLIARQNLRKSHLQASGKSLDSDTLSGRGSSLDLTPIYDSQVELEIIKIVGAKNETEQDAVPETTEEEENVERKRHPSFETWIHGSPHSSDEFDTDVEDEVIESASSSVQCDPTGKTEYEEQCQRHGFVPISYLCRHIGERNVRMRHRYLGGMATKPLALAFQHNTITENLDLSDNHIESTGANFLAKMLKENHFIMSLNLSNNVIGSLGLEEIAEMLEVNTTLKMLSLSGNQLTDKDAYSLIQPLKNNMSLTSLDLSHNEFSVMGGIHLGMAMSANEGIVDLDLSWNCLRKQGGVAIVNALKQNNTLEVLDLSWNGLGLEGALALQKSLQVNSMLKVLDLTNNRLNAKSAEKIAMGLKKNTGLETLILSMNPLGDQGIEMILKAVAPHPTLHFLALERMIFGCCCVAFCPLHQESSTEGLHGLSGFVCESCLYCCLDAKSSIEMGLNSNNAWLINNLENDKDLIILHGGVGGFNRNSGVSNVMRMFTAFMSNKRSELGHLFQQHDKERSGKLSVDDVKICLRLAGLNLTNRYLDLLVEDMDSLHAGELKYSEILSGEAFSEHSRRRPSRGFHLLKAKPFDEEEDEADADDKE